MISLILKSILVFLCFTLEITIHAKEKDFLEHPESCIQKKGDCVIQVKKIDMKAFYFPKFIIHASQESIFRRTDASNIELIKGKFQIEALSSVTVKTEFGQMELSEKSSTLAIKTESNIEVFPIQGLVSYKRPEEESSRYIPIGLNYWVSHIGPDGQSESKFPQVVELRKLIELWSTLDSRKKAEFSDAAKAYAHRWRMTQNEVLGIYKSEAKRELAAYVKEQTKASSASRIYEKEQIYLDKLFKQRYFLNK